MILITGIIQYKELTGSIYKCACMSAHIKECVCVCVLEQTAAEEWLRYQIRVSRQAKAHSGAHHLLLLIVMQKTKKDKNKHACAYTHHTTISLCAFNFTIFMLFPHSHNSD